MAEVYATEEEQWEEVKKWWKKNGSSLVITVALAMTAIFGWQFWQNQQRTNAEIASMQYQQLINAANQNDADLVFTLASDLQSTASSSPYAALGAFAAAKLHVVQEDNEAAMLQYDWVVNHSDAMFHPVAKFRTAQLYAESERWDEALKLINEFSGTEYAYLFNELKGDIALARGNSQEAIAAYKLAIKDMPEDYQSLVRMKLLDLGVMN